jgi:2-methylcitrate dehydratase PrpD
MAVTSIVNDESAAPLATRLLAAFVADASVSQLTRELRQRVKEVVIDWIGVAIGALDNAESTTPIYNSILKFQGGEFKGKNACTVLGKGEPRFLPQYAGLLNATLSHSLEFDDTYIKGTLHSGCTTVSVALTQAEILASEINTDQFMLVITLGYEITYRIGRELGFEAYHRGFHNKSTVGIFGAVAAIAVLKNLPAKTIEMAWGLILSKAAGLMQYLDNGSWCVGDL